MTIFTPIYSGDHNFLQGAITIANTQTNLAIAYLETIVDDIADNPAQPILLGFLYQFDEALRRSKPYPIVSQRQTIPLDMSACTEFLFVPVSRLIDDYMLKLAVSVGGSSGEIDLSGYALLTDIPNLSGYVTDSALTTTLVDYALKSEMQAGLSVKSEAVSIAQGQSISIIGTVLGVFEQMGYNQISPSNMSSPSAPSPFVASASSTYDNSSTYGAWRCFDGQIPNEPDYVSSGSLSSDWVALDLGATKVCRRYTIYPSNVGITNANTPKSWTFQGSLDGTNWITLDTQANISGWVSNTPKIFDFVNSVGYRHYRLNVSQTSGGSFVRIGEIQMFEILGDSYRKSDANYQIIHEANGSQTVSRLASGGVNALILYV